MPVTDPLLERLTVADAVLVVRPFSGDHQYHRGEVVNTEGWLRANIDRLLTRRFISQIPLGFDMDSLYVDEWGRSWIDEDQYNAAGSTVAAAISDEKANAERAALAHLEELRRMGYDISSLQPLSDSESDSPASERSVQPNDEDSAQNGSESVSETAADPTSKDAAPEPKIERPKQSQQNRGKSRR